MLPIILLCLSATLTLIWTLPLIIPKIIGLHLFKIDSREKIALFLRKMDPYSSIIKDENQVAGFIFGFPFIGYIYEYTNQRGIKNQEIWLFTTKYKYKNLMKNNDSKNKDENTMINLYERKGSFWRFEFPKRKLNINRYRAKTQQGKIINKVKKYYEQNDKCVIYLQGEPGCGKSLLVLLTVKEMKGSYCCSHNPTDPGDELSVIYNSVLPTKKQPLIIVLEEFDIIIGQIHNKEIIKHKNIPISVKDKSSWNQYLDCIDLNMYPYLILFLTSNKERKWIDNLDPSYIREGRVDLFVNL